MAQWRRWRFLAAQRSGRVRQTVFFASVGILVVALATALTLWQSQIRTFAGLALAELAPLGLAPVSVIIGGLLVAAALIIYLAPLPKTHSYLATNPQRLPTHAVYVDLENRLPNAALKPLLAHVRSVVKGHRADLVFFADSAHSSTTTSYRAMVGGGFRPVDVPHKRLDQLDGDHENTKNAVDMELSLYAYQQALLSPRPMNIVVVSGDRDFIPLLRRLWVEGHTVQVWALTIAPALDKLAKELGIEAKPFSSLFTWQEAPTSGDASRRSKQRDTRGAADQTAEATGVVGKGSQQPPLRARLESVLNRSADLLKQVRERYGNDPRAMTTLGSLLGDHIKDEAVWLGFIGNGWSKRWKLFMVALGVYRGDVAGALEPEKISAREVADILSRFLSDLATSAHALVSNAPDHVVTYTALRKRLAQVNAADPAAAELRRLLEVAPDGWPNPIIQLCAAAKALNLLQYEPVAGRAAIRVIDA